MWDHIEILCEGTEEVRENRRQIMVTQYEAFMAQPKESVTEMFERFHKLVTELQMNGKVYNTKELNLKFLLSAPNHLEQRVISLRERDLNKISYDVLCSVLKTHELELLQKRAIQANQGRMVNTSCALIVNKSIQDLEASTSQLRIEEIIDDEPEDEVAETVEEQVEDEFYTLE